MKVETSSVKARLITLGAICSLFFGLLGMGGCKEGNETKISAHNSNESHNNGQNCMNCHKKGGEGEGWFNIGGSVYAANLSTKAPNGTVKLYTGPDGTGTLKYTIEVDAKGNFYSTESISWGSGLYPSVTGSGGDVHYMGSTTTTGQCNSCHNVSTDKIWVNN